MNNLSGVEDEYTDLRLKKSLVNKENYISNYESNCLIADETDLVCSRKDIYSLHPDVNRFL